jgi:hypothetical protein
VHRGGNLDLQTALETVLHQYLPSSSLNSFYGITQLKGKSVNCNGWISTWHVIICRMRG